MSTLGASTVVAGVARCERSKPDILRIDYDAGETSLYVNPDLATFAYGNPPEADVVVGEFAPAFDTISVDFREPSSIDELQVLSTK